MIARSGLNEKSVAMKSVAMVNTHKHTETHINKQIPDITIFSVPSIIQNFHFV